MYYKKFDELSQTYCYYSLTFEPEITGFIKISQEEYEKAFDQALPLNPEPTQLDKIEANLDYLVLLNS